MVKKFKVRRGCTAPILLTWPPAKKSDGTEELVTTGSVDGRSVLPETQFVGFRLRVDTTRALFAGGFPSSVERPELDVSSPLGSPHQIVPRGYLLKSFSQGDTSAKQWGFEIRVFHLLGDLPKAIKPHLPLASYTAGNWITASSLRLPPSK